MYVICVATWTLADAVGARLVFRGKIPSVPWRPNLMFNVYATPRRNLLDRISRRMAAARDGNDATTKHRHRHRAFATVVGNCPFAHVGGAALARAALDRQPVKSPSIARSRRSRASAYSPRRATTGRRSDRRCSAPLRRRVSSPPRRRVHARRRRAHRRDRRTAGRGGASRGRKRVDRHSTTRRREREGKEGVWAEVDTAVELEVDMLPGCSERRSRHLRVPRRRRPTDRRRGGSGGRAPRRHGPATAPRGGLGRTSTSPRRRICAPSSQPARGAFGCSPTGRTRSRRWVVSSGPGSARPGGFRSSRCEPRCPARPSTTCAAARAQSAAIGGTERGVDFWRLVSGLVSARVAGPFVGRGDDSPLRGARHAVGDVVVGAASARGRSRGAAGASRESRG